MKLFFTGQAAYFVRDNLNRMKYFLPLLTFFLTAASLSAQTLQGNRFHSLSGNLSIALNTTESSLTPQSKYQTYNLGLQYVRGKFIRDNLAQGFGIDLGVGHIRIPATDYSMMSPSVSGYYLIRKYIAPSERVRVFGQLKAGLTYNPQLYDGKIETNIFGASGTAALGLTYFYRKNWALEALANVASLSVTHSRQQGEKVSTDADLSGTFGLSGFQIGVAKYFGSSSSSFEAPPKQSLYVIGQPYVAADLTGYIRSNVTDNKGFSLGVTAAKFTSPSVALGIGVYGNYGNSEDFNSVKYSNWGASVRPYAEHYWPVSGKWTVWVNGGASLGYSQNKQEAASGTTFNRTTSTTFSLNPNVRPGIQYQLTPQWAIAAMVGILDFKGFSAKIEEGTTQTSSTKTTTYDITITPTYTLGNSGLSLRYFPGR